MNIRQNIVSIARRELGSAHVKGSAQVQRYCESALPTLTPAQIRQAAKSLEWCGIFTLFCLHEAGIALGVRWTLGGGFVLEHGLPLTSTPQPGDIAIRPSPFWHHAIVESLADGTLTTIDGNQPGVVRRIRPAPASNMQYHSIAPLLPAGAEAAPVPVRRTLRQGSSGPDVRTLQERLGGSKVDGYFGARTAEGVLAFQSAAGLKPDGVVGPITWRALGYG